MFTISKKIFKFKITNLLLSINNLTIINLGILFFFSTFGTGLPFREEVIDAYEAESTNLINIIVYGYLLASSLLIITKKPRLIKKVLANDKFFSCFIILALISFLWSSIPILSIKRSSQLLASFLVIFQAFFFNSEIKILNTLKNIFLLYIIVNLLSGILIPQSMDPQFGTLRGIEIQKNGLGQKSLLIFCFSILLLHHHLQLKKNNLIIFLMISFSLLLIILSGSATNIITALIVLLLFFVNLFSLFFKKIGVDKFLLIIILLVLPILLISINFIYGEIIEDVFKLFGKNTDLTGRDMIWPYILSEIKKNLSLGYGYGSYWIMGSEKIALFEEYVGWRVNTAHNGYLEILLQLGIIGLIFFVLTLLSMFITIYRTKSFSIFIMLISILLMNFTESTIFQPRGFTTDIFIFTHFYLLKIAQRLL